MNLKEIDEVLLSLIIGINQSCLKAVAAKCAKKLVNFSVEMFQYFCGSVEHKYPTYIFASTEP